MVWKPNTRKKGYIMVYNSYITFILRYKWLSCKTLSTREKGNKTVHLAANHAESLEVVYLIWRLEFQLFLVFPPSVLLRRVLGVLCRGVLLGWPQGRLVDRVAVEPLGVLRLAAGLARLGDLRGSG